MPTYIRPARVDIIEGDGGMLAAATLALALAAAAVAAFVLAHLLLLAAAAAVLAVVPVGAALAMRRFIQPRGIRRWHREQELSARRVPLAIPAPPKAIEAPRAVTGQVVTPTTVPVRQARP